MQLLINRDDERKYIYQQIYDNIKQQIMSKQFVAHEQLPSKRGLAEQLHVSVNSVTTAYEQLLAEGYIYTIERSGYFVESITELLEKKIPDYCLPSDLKEKKIDQTDWLSLSHISVDASMFPFHDWLKCTQKVITNKQAELEVLSHFQGPYEVRESIARSISQTREVICEPEQIVIGAGTQHLIERLISLKPKTTKLAMENPGYHRFFNLLKRMNYQVSPISLDEQGINMEELAGSNAEIVFVTPSHQFPTGTIMPISRRNELLNWANEDEERFIIEDDYDSEFKYKTDHIPSLQSLDRNQQVVYTGTFSKTTLPSLRISYMVLPFHLLREYRQMYGDLMQEVNAMSLYTLHYFMEEGMYQKHVRRMNYHYEKKRKLLIQALKEKFKGNITIKDVPAGLHFLTFFKTEKTYEEIQRKAQEEKLELFMLNRFILANDNAKNGEIGIIIGFANIKEEKINEAIERLSCVVM